MTGGHACTACLDRHTSMHGFMHTVTCQHFIGIGCHLRWGQVWSPSGTAECVGSRGAMREIFWTMHTVAPDQRTARVVVAGHAPPHPEGIAAVLSNNEQRGSGDM